MREQETDSQEARRQLRRISALLIVLVSLIIAGVVIGCGVLYYYNVHLPHARAVSFQREAEAAFYNQLKSAMEDTRKARQGVYGYTATEREIYDIMVDSWKTSHDRLRWLGVEPPKRVIPPYE